MLKQTDLGSIVAPGDDAIPLKYRELIAMAVAYAVQGGFCIEAYTAAAKRAGANIEEVVEAIFIASALERAAAPAGDASPISATGLLGMLGHGPYALRSRAGRTRSKAKRTQ